MSGSLASPAAFGLLVGLAIVLVWLAFAPSRRKGDVEERLDGYLEGEDVIDELDIGQPFAKRVLVPLFRQILGLLGRFTPQRTVESTRTLLVQAGEPGQLSPLDFFGLRLLCAVLLAFAYFLLMGQSVPFSVAVRNTLFAAVLGYFLPRIWLGSRARRRRHEITRALPDTLDMLTIGVEAGLAFDSAMLKVGDRWDNALTREFRRAVLEMRVGTARNEALRRMAERTGVSDLGTFVAVLVQSSNLGVSIAQVLHIQAEQMRLKRRQRAEELARQAGIKMIFPLALFVFPALLIVILGPSVPLITGLFRSLGGGPGMTGLP